MSVQPHLSLITVSVEEPGMILITDRVLVARVIPQCRVGLEGVPVRTAYVYTENLNTYRNSKHQKQKCQSSVSTFLALQRSQVTVTTSVVLTK